MTERSTKFGLVALSGYTDMHKSTPPDQFHKPHVHVLVDDGSTLCGYRVDQVFKTVREGRRQYLPCQRCQSALPDGSTELSYELAPTEKQRSYLSSLAWKLGVTAPKPVTRQEASEVIERLKGMAA